MYAAMSTKPGTGIKQSTHHHAWCNFHNLDDAKRALIDIAQHRIDEGYEEYKKMGLEIWKIDHRRIEVKILIEAMSDHEYEGQYIINKALVHASLAWSNN